MNMNMNSMNNMSNTSSKSNAMVGMSVAAGVNGGINYNANQPRQPRQSDGLALGLALVPGTAHGIPPQSMPLNNNNNNAPMHMAINMGSVANGNVNLPMHHLQNNMNNGGPPHMTNNNHGF